MGETHTTTVATTPAAPAVPDAPAAASPAFPAFAEAIPAQYRERTWAQDISKNEKPWDELFRQHDHAHSLVGKKSEGLQVPGDDAAPEAVKAFHKALGVPESDEGYDYKAPDYAKETEQVQNVLKELGKDDSFFKSMRGVAHQLGLTPKQFNGIAAAFDGHNLEQVKGLVQTHATSAQTKDAAHAATLKQLYGDGYESVVNTSKETLRKVLPESIRNLNDPQMALVEIGKYLHDKLFKNDKIGASDGGADGPTTGDVRSQIMKLRQSDAFKNFTHPDHGTTKAKVKELYIAESKMNS